MATVAFFSRYVFQNGSDADWNFRSSGAIIADRLETQAKLDDWKKSDDLVGNLSIETSIKVTGAIGSFKIAVNSVDSANSGSFSIPLTSFRNNVTRYFSIRLYMPDEAAYQQWCANEETGQKYYILSRDQNGSGDQGSNQNNEVVGQDNERAGHYSMYWQDGAASAIFPDLAAVTDCSGSDFIKQPSIDNSLIGPYYPLIGTNPDDGSAWTACQQDVRQYGHLYSQKSVARYQQGVGDPLSGGVRHRGGVWTTQTFRLITGTVDGAATDNRLTSWIAHEHEGYTLVHDKTNITLGNGPDFNGFNPMPYVSQRSPGGRKVSAVGSGISGITVLACGPANHTGVGKLEYVASNGRFRYHAANDSYGDPHGFSVANDIMILNLKGTLNGVATTTNGSVTLPQSSIVLTSAASFPTAGSMALGDPDTSTAGSGPSHGNGEQYITWTGKSSNTLTGCSGGTGTHDSGVPVSITSFISIRIDNPALLPSSGTTEIDITIAEGRPNTAVYYNDFIMSASPIPAPGRYPLTLPAWVPTTIGEWDQISGTEWSNVNPNPPLVAGLGGTGVQAKVSNWTGVAVDQRNGRLYGVAGGGHNGYAGNEVDVLHLLRETPVWEQIRPPTIDALLLDDTDYYADGTPTSRHHYYGIHFIEKSNKVMLLGGAGWAASGGFFDSIDAWDVRSNSYDAADFYPKMGASFSGDVIAICADTRNGDIYLFKDNAVGRWKRETNAMTEVSASHTNNPKGNRSASAYDSKRHRFFVVGGTEDDKHLFDVATLASTEITLTGAQAATVQTIENDSSMVYVPAIDAFLLAPAPGTGGVVYKIDAASPYACTTFSTTGGGSIPACGDNGGGNEQGMYAKFIYVEKLKSIIHIPRHNAGIWCLRVHS